MKARLLSPTTSLRCPEMEGPITIVGRVRASSLHLIDGKNRPLYAPG
jgi:hypothetical protein